MTTKPEGVVGDLARGRVEVEMVAGGWEEELQASYW